MAFLFSALRAHTARSSTESSRRSMLAGRILNEC